MAVIVLDGAMGTLLDALGVPTPPPLWSAHAVAHHPDAVRAVHHAYAEAGATVHTAATFRTAPASAGDQAEALTRAAVRLAREAVPPHHRVAGSLAPVEDCWHPERSPPDAAEHHMAQAARLARAGVDLVLVETFAHPDEAVAATRAAKATGLPVWTALTPGFDGRLLDPDALAAAALRVAEAGAEIVLVNCLPALRSGPWVRALAATGLRWGVYANAGAPHEGLRHGTPGAGPRYGALAAAWIRHGASVVGGCCGTGPASIAAVAAVTNGPQAVDIGADGG